MSRRHSFHRIARSLLPLALLVGFVMPASGQSGFGSSSNVLKAIDADGDGALSPEEIAHAPVALRCLDDDGDGQLSKKELGTARSRWSAWGDGDWGDSDWGDMDDWDDMGGGDDMSGGGWGRGRGRDDRTPRGDLLEPTAVPAKHGQSTIEDRATFRRLSYKTGMVMEHLEGREFVKFQIMGPDTETPRLYFINTEAHPTHMTFMRAIGGRARDGMRGVLVRRPLLLGPDGQPGMFTFEFDLPKVHSFERIQLAHRLLQEKAAILRDRLLYHPMERAVEAQRKERSRYEAAAIGVITNDQLYENVGFLPLHPAESFGRLRVMSPQERPSPRDVVICDELPNEMPRVAGIVSGAFQTPLSHVNLRAIQDRVPNAYLRGGAEHPQVAPLIGKYVYYRVTADGFELREATADEVQTHFAAIRPPEPQVPCRDLTKRTIRSLDQLGFEDSTSIGVKAANIAALRKLDLPAGIVPEGFAVPFYFYDEFMKYNGFYVRAAALAESSELRANADDREAALRRFRRVIEAGRVPRWMSNALGELQASFPAGSSIRCRSSTNNEDLPGFSGAGLYDSFTHRPDEGHLSKSIKQVFASLWNFRAFEEREFFRVDHLATAMAVLVHPNFPDELANGVAVTEDVLYEPDRKEERYYVNTQVGADLVTNPESASIPEEMLMSPKFAVDDVMIRASNRSPEGKAILGWKHTTLLRLSLKTIEREFAKLYEKKADEKFAMEIEFKVTKDGAFVIKQARPWVY